MESGLSLRMQVTLKESLAASSAPPPVDPTTIDLSNAQNEVLRSELLQLFKKTIQEQATNQTFAFPAGNGGDVQAREALATFFNDYFAPIHVIKNEHIVLTAGVSDAIENLIHAICDDGDSVLVPGPSWYGFAPLLKARANVNIIQAQPPAYENYDNYLVPSLRAVYDFSADKSRIKAVLICNPQNPGSRCYDRQALLDVMEFCQENELHLIVDEMYALMNLKNQITKAPPFVSALSLTEPLARSGAVKVDPSRVHVLWSASKLFGLSGLRIGCLITQQNPALHTAVSHLTASHMNSIATLYLSNIFTRSILPSLLTTTQIRLTHNYEILSTALKRHRIDFVPPSHGIFLFAKLAKHARSAADEKAFYDALSVNAGVLVAQGRLFKGVEGEFGWARIKFSANADVLRVAVSKIEKFLTQRERT